MTPSQSAIADFKVSYAFFCQENANAIDSVRSLISANADKVDDLYWDVIDDLKSELGAAAANKVECPKDQEIAIAECESWVANEAPETVSLLLWSHGTKAGEQIVREALDA